MSRPDSIHLSDEELVRLHRQSIAAKTWEELQSYCALLNQRWQGTAALEDKRIWLEEHSKLSAKSSGIA